MTENTLADIDTTPRCGDYPPIQKSKYLVADTTPRVRGLLVLMHLMRLQVRYNPACAGTTWTNGLVAPVCPIQPRVCGDYRSEVVALHQCTDTTPRVRGLPCAAAPSSAAARYNPACAGTTYRPDYHSAGQTIQPRVCGDYLPIVAGNRSAHDTTPRVRGLRRDRDQYISALRYNPACAGTTDSPHKIAVSFAIQPRVCGDYSSQGFQDIHFADTTPRVRGLQDPPKRPHAESRYNPACAGTT